MRPPPPFVAMACGPWRLWVAPRWTPLVEAVVAAQAATGGWVHGSKHARTRRIEIAGAPAAYLKTYHAYRWVSVLKDCARPSKARRALMMSEALRQAGFPVAPVAVAGERRLLGWLRGAFLVSEAMDAPDAIAFVAALAGAGDAGGSRLARKRRFLRTLGQHVARLHAHGFCHGDLVPANVRVRGADAAVEIVLLDHDRTRHGRRPVALRHARRNLVQLNRFVVPGLTAADRWRVFTAYCTGRGIAPGARRRLARWVIAKTVERRRDFDGVREAERLGFRALMRAADADEPARDP
jgi:hypothetical protein